MSWQLFGLFHFDPRIPPMMCHEIGSPFPIRPLARRELLHYIHVHGIKLKHRFQFSTVKLASSRSTPHALCSYGDLGARRARGRPRKRGVREGGEKGLGGGVGGAGRGGMGVTAYPLGPRPPVPSAQCWAHASTARVREGPGAISVRGKVPLECF